MTNEEIYILWMIGMSFFQVATFCCLLDLRDKIKKLFGVQQGLPVV